MEHWVNKEDPLWKDEEIERLTRKLNTIVRLRADHRFRDMLEVIDALEEE